jgi:TonB family protein
MMTKKFKHNRHSWLRTVGAVPLVAAMMMLFGFTHRAPEIITPEPKITETTTVTAGGDGVVVSGLPVDIITISHKEGEPDVTHKLDDRLIYWLRNENREITADEMKAINPSDIQTVSVLKEKSIFPAEVRSAMGDRNIDGAVLIELKTSEVGKDAPIYIADEMPKFEGGGLSDFRNWLMNRIVYPKDAVDKNIQGKVTLKFVVEEDGSVSNIEVLSSPDQLLSDEAVRVMKLSPKWTPGKQDGKPARIYYILPVDFALSGK